MKNLKIKDCDFIGNAKIINIEDLPKINEKNIYNHSTCIEVKIKEFKDDYIIYEVIYCEDDSLDLLDDLYCDCFKYQYAIKKIKK